MRSSKGIDAVVLLFWLVGVESKTEVVSISASVVVVPAVAVEMTEDGFLIASVDVSLLVWLVAVDIGTVDAEAVLTLSVDAALSTGVVMFVSVYIILLFPVACFLVGTWVRTVAEKKELHYKYSTLNPQILTCECRPWYFACSLALTFCTG